MNPNSKARIEFACKVVNSCETTEQLFIAEEWLAEVLSPLEWLDVQPHVGPRRNRLISDLVDVSDIGP